MEGREEGLHIHCGYTLMVLVLVLERCRMGGGDGRIGLKFVSPAQKRLIIYLHCAEAAIPEPVLLPDHRTTITPKDHASDAPPGVP